MQRPGKLITEGVFVSEIGCVNCNLPHRMEIYKRGVWCLVLKFLKFGSLIFLPTRSTGSHRRSDAMLPKLSKKRVMFQEAEPEPAFISARRNALLDLKSINSLRVSALGKGSHTRYVVEVFTDTLHCRTTTSTDSSRSSASRTCNDACESQDESSPSVRIERKLEDFVDLRDKLYQIMFSAHRRQYCKFCLHVMDAVINGVDPDGFFFTLLGQQRTVCRLTKFTEDLLAPTLQHACVSTQGCCSAQTLVPQALHAFLFTPDRPVNA